MYNKGCVKEIDMWTLVFPRDLYRNLTEFLFSTTPSENGCFLLAGFHKTENNAVILINRIIKPSKDSWNYRKENALEPRSSFINQCVVSADTEGSSLIFVHTHPKAEHPSGFSHIDEKSNDKLFDNLSQILVDKPLGSLVFSRKGVCGVIFDGGTLRSVAKIKVSGNLLDEFSGVGYNTHTSDNVEGKFDRQSRVLGRQGNKKLQKLTVTVVGAGGTGSAVAVQLARMGISKLRLVDMDVIEDTNVPRVYGSSEQDIGKPKVDVLKKHIRMFSSSKIDAIYSDVTDNKALTSITNSDVIFACTDNLTSRSRLNDISIRYMIPLIDVGCRIDLNDDGSISQATVKVQTVTPESACLWCDGTLDGTKILQESLSDKERRDLAREGYYDGVEVQPSIISMTTMSASMAVNKLLCLLGTFGDAYNSRTRIELKDSFIINDTPEVKNGCICRKNRGKVGSRITTQERKTSMSKQRTSLMRSIFKYLRKIRIPWRHP